MEREGWEPGWRSQLSRKATSTVSVEMTPALSMKEGVISGDLGALPLEEEEEVLVLADFHMMSGDDVKSTGVCLGVLVVMSIKKKRIWT